MDVPLGAFKKFGCRWVSKCKPTCLFSHHECRPFAEHVNQFVLVKSPKMVPFESVNLHHHLDEGGTNSWGTFGISPRPGHFSVPRTRWQSRSWWLPFFAAVSPLPPDRKAPSCPTWHSHQTPMFFSHLKHLQLVSHCTTPLFLYGLSEDCDDIGAKDGFTGFSTERFAKKSESSSQQAWGTAMLTPLWSELLSRDFKVC